MDVTVLKCEKPLKNGHCYDVTVQGTLPDIIGTKDRAAGIRIRTLDRGSRPQDLSSRAARMDIGKWLRSLGLERYEAGLSGE